MKKLLPFLIFLLLPVFAFADFSRPIVSTTTSGTIFAFPAKVNNKYPNLMSPFFYATSTTLASQFPLASTTAVSATSFCLTTCITSFSSALGYIPWGGSLATTYGVITIASTTPPWFQSGFYASSTSQIVYASTTAISTASLYTTASSTIGGVLNVAGTATSTFDGALQGSYLNIIGTSATSTFATGVDITTGTGCFAIAGTCLQTIVSSASAYKQAVRFASTSTLPANTYNNGSSGVGATLTGNSNAAFYIDGNTPTAGDRVLIKNEAAGANNGIYIVSQLGSGILPYILTRATDYNSSADVFPGVASFTNGGTQNANTCWILTNISAVTIGTTALTYADECGAGSFTATLPLVLTGTTFSTLFSTTSDMGLPRNMLLTTSASGLLVASSSPTAAIYYATSTSLTSFFPNASTTHLTAGTSFQIPTSATQAPTVSGYIAQDTTNGQIVVGRASATDVFDPRIRLTLSYATTTAWTGTTTLPVFVIPQAMTINTAQCVSDVGTLNTQLQYGTAPTRLTMFSASTTIGIETFTTNNTPTAGATSTIAWGTPASSPTQVSCTFVGTITGT